MPGGGGLGLALQVDLQDHQTQLSGISEQAMVSLRCYSKCFGSKFTMSLKQSLPKPFSKLSINLLQNQSFNILSGLQTSLNRNLGTISSTCRFPSDQDETFNHFPITKLILTVDFRLHSPSSNLLASHFHRCAKWRLLAPPSDRRNRLHRLRFPLHGRNTTKVVSSRAQSARLAHWCLELARCKYSPYLPPT